MQPDVARSVRVLLEPGADPARAEAMRAYMKDVAEFLGLPAAARRCATKAWIARFDPACAPGLIAAARELVGQPEREFAYTAIDLLARHHRALSADDLLALREIVMIRPWWDTVDAMSTLIGRVGLRHASWDATVAAWATDPQLWVRRIALVFQVGRKDKVDLDILFDVCRANFADRDFFMRKGIGWALRDAARTYPDEVWRFVDANSAQMSGLSRREATKHRSA